MEILRELQVAKLWDLPGACSYEGNIWHGMMQPCIRIRNSGCCSYYVLDECQTLASEGRCRKKGKKVNSLLPCEVTLWGSLQACAPPTAGTTCIRVGLIVAQIIVPISAIIWEPFFSLTTTGQLLLFVGYEVTWAGFKFTAGETKWMCLFSFQCSFARCTLLTHLMFRVHLCGEQDALFIGRVARLYSWDGLPIHIDDGWHTYIYRIPSKGTALLVGTVHCSSVSIGKGTVLEL